MYVAIARGEQSRAEFHAGQTAVLVDISRVRVEADHQHQSIEVRGIVSEDVPLVLISDGHVRGVQAKDFRLMARQRAMTIEKNQPKVTGGIWKGRASREEVRGRGVRGLPRCF